MLCPLDTGGKMVTILLWTEQSPQGELWRPIAWSLTGSQLKNDPSLIDTRIRVRDLRLIKKYSTLPQEPPKNLRKSKIPDYDIVNSSNCGPETDTNMTHGPSMTPLACQSVVSTKQLPDIMRNHPSNLPFVHVFFANNILYNASDIKIAWLNSMTSDNKINRKGENYEKPLWMRYSYTSIINK